MRKIAVATEDGRTISNHFGRSRSFLVYEIENNQIVGMMLRDNRFTAHALGQCGQDNADHHHGHGAIVEALRDCEAVLCYGMGWRAAEDLKQAGIQAFLLPGETSPDDAVRAYLSGELKPAEGFCRCHG